MKILSNFDKRLQTLTPSILSDIAKIDERKGMWTAGAKLNPILLGRLKQSVLITSTGASTRIEGANLSDEDVEKLMRGLSIEKFTDRDEQEVKGYFELLQNVFNSWNDLSFSENSIKHFHKELLKYVEKDKLHRGEYKKTENKVHMINAKGESVGILFDTTPAYLTPVKMQELVEWTKKALNEKIYHSLLIIGNFLVEFLQIHPSQYHDPCKVISKIIIYTLLMKKSMNEQDLFPYLMTTVWFKETVDLYFSKEYEIIYQQIMDGFIRNKVVKVENDRFFPLVRP